MTTLSGFKELGGKTPRRAHKIPKFSFKRWINRAIRAAELPMV